MLYLRNILNTLARKGNAGASVDDLRNEFGDEELEEIKRLVQSAVDLGEAKKDGKGRGVRYYLPNIEVPHLTTGPKTYKKAEGNFIDGKIDISNCVTVKEKVDRIISSDHKLSQVYCFDYRKDISQGIYNRELYDYINTGIVDVTVKVGCVDGKNKIISKKEKILANKLVISRNSDGEWIIEKIHHECPNRPDVIKFSNQSEFEKCLRTILPK